MKHFWTEGMNWRKSLSDFVSESKKKGNISTSQRHVIIKLIEKDIEMRDSNKFGETFLCLM